MKHESKESHYFNSEMSWLAFNERVFAASKNAAYPILERVRFLGIAANNLMSFIWYGETSIKSIKKEQHKKSIDGVTNKSITPIIKKPRHGTNCMPRTAMAPFTQKTS